MNSQEPVRVSRRRSEDEARHRYPFVGCGVVILAVPIVGVAAAVVRWKHGAPSFYVSRRVGERGRPFRLYKIRTMSEEAERGPLGSVTTGDDPRVTVTGRVLRRWKIDELPQFLNVLLGDMSMVGPRPETPEYVALYTQEEREIPQVPSGHREPGFDRIHPGGRAPLAGGRSRSVLRGEDHARGDPDRSLLYAKSHGVE